MSVEVEGKIVAITGSFRRSRQELADALVALGAKVTDSVGPKTQLLFAGEKVGSKLAKAKALAIPVYGEEELAELLAAAPAKRGAKAAAKSGATAGSKVAARSGAKARSKSGAKTAAEPAAAPTRASAPQDSAMAVEGKVVAITGSFRRPRQELADALTALGAKVTDSVGARTQLLFAGEKAGSKLAKAKSLAIPVYGEEELAALIAAGGAAPAAKSGASEAGAKARSKSGDSEAGAKDRSAGWADWGAAAAAKDPLAHARALVEGDWSGFVAARDLAPLRALLARAEAQSGVTEVHRAAGARLRERGAQVVHPFGHRTQVGSAALSLDGRYLVTGSWIGDDYAEGGSLVVWEVASGRCVNVLPRVEGGVGWPDYARCLQWSPDGRTIGAVFNTNGVGAFEAFGEKTQERAVAYVTNGWSRPPGWVWAPDGVRALVACWGEDAPIPGAVVRLDRGATHEKIARWFRGPADPRLGDAGSIGYGAEVGWSAEDLVLLAADSSIFGVRAEDGTIAWIFERAGRTRWLDDRAHFVVIAGESLSVHRTADGQRIGEGQLAHDEARVRSGSPGAGGRFLVYGPAIGVEVWQGGTRVAAVETSLREGHYSQPDLEPAALSLDGGKFAVLTEEGELVVRAAADPERTVCTAGPFEGALGLYYGAEETIVVVGPDALTFVDGATGALRGAFRLLEEAPGAPPLETDDHGDLAALFRRDPCFALAERGARAWCVALPEGAVVCPTTHRGQVDATLALVVERRFAWPLRWSDVPIVETVAEAAAGLSAPPAKALRRAFPLVAGRAKAAKRPAAESFPPAERGSLDDVFAGLVSAMEPLHSGWHLAIAEYLRRAAETCARLGRGDLVEQALAAIPDGDCAYEVAAGAGRCAALLAAREPERARALLQRAEAVASRARQDHDLARLFVACGLAAGRAALGDARGADAAFKKARGWIDRETNPGQHISELTGALALAGRLDEALELFTARIPGSHAWHFGIKALDLLLMRGGAAAWRRVHAGLAARGEEVSEFGVLDVIVRELGLREEWDEAFAAVEQIRRIWLVPAREALVRGLSRRGRLDEALARAEGLASASEPPQRASWLAVMAELAPERARAQVLAAARKVDEETGPTLATALARVGARAEALKLVRRLSGPARVEAAGNAALAGPPDPALLQALEDGLPQEPAQERRLAAAWTRLSAAARRAGDTERAQALLAAAVDGVKDATQKRWVYEAALGAAIEAGDLTGGHELLARFPRASRHRPSRTLAEGCAQLGHHAGAAKLLAGLPGDDMNDRPQAAFVSFMNAAYRELFGPGARWTW